MLFASNTRRLTGTDSSSSTSGRWSEVATTRRSDSLTSLRRGVEQPLALLEFPDPLIDRILPKQPVDGSYQRHAMIKCDDPLLSHDAVDR
jgi:hypothetical protein